MVRIITDSAADLEMHEYEQMMVTCIPICISFGDTEYQENIDLTKEQFYRLLEESEASPRTAHPSPLAVETELKDAMAAGDEAVVIPFHRASADFFKALLPLKTCLNMRIAIS